MTVIFIDEELGVDAHETPGTASTPFKTLLEALFHHGPDTQYRVMKKDDEEYKPAAKSALKKAANYAANQRKKLQAAAKREEKEATEDAAREAVLEETKMIQIIDDPALPKPILISLIETDRAIIGHLRKSKDETKAVRVRVQGRVQRVAKQGDLSKTYQALTLTRETAMEITGEMWEVPTGHDAPLDRELRAGHFKIISPAPGGDDTFTNRVPLGGDAQTLLNLRHLALRQEKPLGVMFVRHVVETAFHTIYKELDFRKFDYYGETSYLTQSSQLYLETVLPVLGDVYCIEKSFRAEKALTRQLTLETPKAAEAIKKHNPDFSKPPRPFLRMRYSDAIEWLRERGIKNEEDKDHVFGDDFAEAAERKMTDEINRPIFLTHFPAEIKSFYMPRSEEDKRVTESVDVLLPGVGEIVGGSMRIWDYEELMAAYKREDIDPTSYYWYTGQHKYGSTPHGGYGLGVERCEILGFVNG
ncbi:hypothetical protein QQX98_011366 [Neonectria punicea]|uniref:asparagine--tRNA ligase n=1 Tax=Neonectria punicea TaxID=979145 RepID=A0ABR1GLU6_9HYPO